MSLCHSGQASNWILCNTCFGSCQYHFRRSLYHFLFPWGLAGAAFATLVSQSVGGFVPLFYFARNNPSLLQLGKATWDFNALRKTCTNGSSELLSNIAMPIVAMVYNVQFLKYAGEDGVAAFGVLMYLSLIFQSIFIGYSIGILPIISYHYGAQNPKKLREVFRNSLVFIAMCAFAIVYCCIDFCKASIGYFCGL